MLSGVQQCCVEFERSQKNSVGRRNIPIILGVVERCWEHPIQQYSVRASALGITFQSQSTIAQQMFSQIVESVLTPPLNTTQHDYTSIYKCRATLSEMLRAF